MLSAQTDQGAPRLARRRVAECGCQPGSYPVSQPALGCHHHLILSLSFHSLHLLLRGSWGEPFRKSDLFSWNTLPEPDGGSVNSNSRKRLLRWGGLALIAGFLFLNAIAFHQSRGLIRFAAADKAPRRHGWKAALLGVELPRPVNKTDPSAIGLPFTTRTFQGAKGEKIEAWVLPTDTAPLGTVITFHGHAGSKESLMSVSATLHRWGWKVWMVDFYGSGGSSGQETSIGWFEADDVRAAFEEVQKDSSGQRVVLYGSSMGAAAVMRSVAVHELSPHGVILECPFDRLRTTVASRFKREGAPTFPKLVNILK